MRQVRAELKFSQDSTARQIGLSRDQLNRIERGEVAVRFFPAWHLCRLANLNPLWLAFGGTEEKEGFVACGNNVVPPEAPFFEVMVLCGDLYRKYRQDPLSLERRIGTDSVFIPERLQDLSGGVIVRVPAFALGSGKEAQKILELESRKHNLRQMLDQVSNWAELRKLLLSETATPGAKTSLARHFKVTTQAVSQWLSGKTKPSADTALRLRDWLLNKNHPTKQSAGSAATRPAPNRSKLRKSTHEKSNKPSQDRK
jgi:transcriptional regulator with XRE-family HTH domain